MQFGLHLLRRGLITPQQFMAALAHQQECRVPLGRLAVDLGLLTEGELLRVLQWQTDLTSNPFGEVAIELGLLTREDLATLLVHQIDCQVPLHECLVQLEIMNPEQVAVHLNSYRVDCETSFLPSDLRIGAPPPAEGVGAASQ